MRDKLARMNREGQPIGADTGRGAQLARWLPGCGLEKLTDDEAARLIEFMEFLDSVAADEGFKCGWDAMSMYTHDQRLLDAGPPMNH